MTEDQLVSIMAALIAGGQESCEYEVLDLAQCVREAIKLREKVLAKLHPPGSQGVTS